MMEHESIMSRLAVLENTVDKCLPSIQKVSVLETDMKHLSDDISGLKKDYERSRKERLEQYETLTMLITQKHEETTREIQPLASGLQEIKTAFSTVIWILAALGGTLTVLASIYTAIPK